MPSLPHRWWLSILGCGTEWHSSREALRGSGPPGLEEWVWGEPQSVFQMVRFRIQSTLQTQGSLASDPTNHWLKIFRKRKNSRKLGKAKLEFVMHEITPTYTAFMSYLWLLTHLHCIRYCKSVVPDLFGTRDQFHGRQLSQRLGLGDPCSK